MIVTFDKGGISNHPNHIAVHNGVAKVFENSKFPIDVMTLNTVGIIRKYTGFIDIQNCMPNDLNFMCLSPLTSFLAMKLHYS